MQRRYRRRKPKVIETKVRLKINHQIQAPVLRVIDDEGNMLGDLSREEALRRAEESEMDLVEVSPKANPPVVRIADYGQIKYERDKKMRKQKATQKAAETKGIRLSFRIKGADLDTRANQALKFLEAGNNVKVELQLRGRERAHKDKAREVVQSFVERLGDNFNIIAPLSSKGGRISIEITKR